MRDLNIVINSQPKEANHYIRRAIVFKHLNRIAEAERDFTRAVQIKPSEVTFEKRGGFYNELKAYDKAVADFNAALKIDPGTKMAQRGLSIAYEGLGRKDLAAKARARAQGEMEGLLDQYSRASDGFSRLKHSLEK